MTVNRLRPYPTPDELAVMYPKAHDHRLYGRGHGERVDATIALALTTLPPQQRVVVGDLSCGNGAIALALTPARDRINLHLGDLAILDAALPGSHYMGPLEQTLWMMPHVDTYICSETLEHVNDPGTVLATIRAQADHLVLSTPLECWDGANGEHLWAWDRAGIEDLMTRTGWRPAAFTSVDSRTYGEPYLYGIWVAS